MPNGNRSNRSFHLPRKWDVPAAPACGRPGVPSSACPEGGGPPCAGESTCRPYRAVCLGTPARTARLAPGDACNERNSAAMQNQPDLAWDSPDSALEPIESAGGRLPSRHGGCCIRYPGGDTSAQGQRFFDADQAEAITEAVRAGVTGGVATKAGLAELRADMAELRAGVAEVRTELRWMKAAGGVIVAALV